MSNLQSYPIKKTYHTAVVNLVTLNFTMIAAKGQKIT